MTVNQPHSVATADGPGAREHKGLLVGAAAMMAAGFLTTFLSPLLAISFAKEFEFGIGSAGLLVAFGQGGVALSAFGILPFLPGLDRRRVGMAGALVTSAALASTGFATGFGTVLALQIVTGLGAGLCYACANSALAYARLPERAFSIVTMTWMLVGAFMLTLGPTLHELWPKAGVLLGMAAAVLLCVIFITQLPDVRRLPKNDEAAAQLENAEGPAGIVGLAMLLLSAVALLEIGNAMVWTFAEPIGMHAGLSAQGTGTFLGLSQLVGLVGAGITLAVGAKVPKMILFVPAAVTLGLGNLLVGTAASPAPFIIGFLAINVAFFCAIPLLLSLAAELDTSSGRLVVLAGGAALVAGAAAPALGAFIAGENEHWSRLGVTALILVLLAIPLLVLPVRVAKHRVALSADPGPNGQVPVRDELHDE
ncbi:MAG: MFS transporter [Actinomycetia bacterium]|nr:MFS transporter [Actinomycetes bacterium]MCH9701730.1 MFS transporter [Actinomycetes bacterium]MCH9760437.1 MFS transporter [Actinomycetes bacterium]